MRQEEIDQILALPGIKKIVPRSPITFIHGDNMAFLRWMKEEMMWKYFHLGIVDPPYGISVGNMKLGATSKSKPKDYKMGEWDNKVPTQEYWDLMDYCCRNLIVWGGNYFTKELNWSGRSFLVWDKLNNGMSFADCELALTTFDESARIIRKSRAIKQEDEGGLKRHPTHKPVYLYDYIHLNFVEKEQRVLDTHGGSMSHAVAAFKNNVKLTIIEADDDYFADGLSDYERASTKGRLLF